MKRRTTLLLVTVLVLSVATAGAVQAKAPGMGDRSGDLDLALNLGAVLPGSVPLDGITWYGTIVFDSVPYDIVYRTTEPVGNDVVTHWSETWEVFEPGKAGILVELGVVVGYDAAAVPLMTGFDKGITHLKKAMWIGNGPVLTADGPFAQWEGHRAHTKG
ncbi:MAG: hypothetical protein ACR2N7_06310, partial [Acidimicrobiia bacterium]